MKRIFIVTTVLFLSINVFAQIPQFFNYQAIVRNSGGELIKQQSVGVKVGIFRTPFFGKLIKVYEETHKVTTNENGVITLFVGSGTPVIGEFSDIDFSILGKSKGYSIKTEIDPKGGINYTISGTEMLACVPYAKVAEKATSLQTKSIPINIYGAFLTDATFSKGFGVNAGIKMPNTNNSNFSISFVIPDDYDSEDEIILRLIVSANGTGVVDLRPNAISIARAGVGFIQGSGVASGLTIDAINITTANRPESVNGKIVCPVKTDVLKAGDAITFNYYRNSSDINTGNFMIHGIEIMY